MSDEDDVLAVNEAFYSAVEAGDLDALRAVWVEDENSVCVHPGAGPIHGTSGVLRSWALVMANTDYIQFFLTEVSVTVAGDTAALTCTENILSAGNEAAAFRGARARALNVLTRSGNGGWRVRVHQAAPVVSDDI